MAGEDGFLSRWARRKADARQGKPLDEPELPPVVVTQTVGQGRPARQEAGAPAAPAHPQPQPAVPEAPPLTLQDTQALTPQSDFKPFMAQRVNPAVRNAAMKKLFADPHYNVMDGLDTYIDDYTLSDPIPESMLRNMVGAQFLNLFDDPPAPPGTPPADSHDAPGNAQPVPVPAPAPVPVPVAQSPDSTEPLTPDHAHTHLRLQPDHAPASPGTGSGPA